MKELVELKQAAFELSKVVASLGDSLDLPKVDAEIASLEEQQNADGFWNDQKNSLFFYFYFLFSRCSWSYRSCFCTGCSWS